MPTASAEQPRPGTEELLRYAQESLLYTVTRPEKVMVRGKGSYLWDSDGNEYLDFIAGWAVNCLGHSPPVLVRALQRQARELINSSPALYNEPMIRLARLLTEHSCLDKVFFTSTGAEANEGAVKLARKYGVRHLNGAYEVITCWNGFHGRTLAMMSASGKKAWDSLFEPKVPGFVRVPFNDLEAVAAAVSSKTCGIMVEPVQGEAGVFPAEEHFLRGLRRLCDERGIPLIFDEIQTGVGRTGTLFGYQHHGVEPDIMTLGKGIGGGVPLAAMLAKDPFCVFEQGEQGGTYTGQPLPTAAGLAVVGEVIGRNLPHKAHLRGRHLRRRMEELAGRFGLHHLRGRGLLQALDLPEARGPDVVRACLEEGLIVNSPRPESLRFMPALTVSNREIDEMAERLSAGLRRVL